MPTTRSNLEALFDEKEQYAFLQMMVKTERAISAFRDDPELVSESRKTFKVEGSHYTLDRHCEIDFTMLNTTISMVRDKPDNAKILNQSIDEVSGKIKNLLTSLNLFIKMDTNTERKSVYQNALTYLNKIEQCFEPADEKNENDSSNTVKFKM